MKSKREVVQKAQREQRTVPFATVVDMRNLKDAACTEQGSSVSQMTASKVMGFLARLQGCAGEAADAVSTHTQVTVEDASALLTFPNPTVPRYLETSSTPQVNNMREFSRD